MVHTASATPEPSLIYFEDIGEWRMSSGFIYLHDDCQDFTGQTSANVRRRATFGSIIETLELINGSPECRTFRHATADESGFYFYNRRDGTIEAIYSDSPEDPPAVLASIGDWAPIGSGDGISALHAFGDHLYWIQVEQNGEFNPDTITIFGLPKSGGTPSTLVTYSTASLASFRGLGVTSRYIWWTDSDGLNRTHNCLLQPCFPGSVEKVVEFSTIGSEGHIEMFGSSVTWWSNDADPEVIRRTTCSLFTGTCSTTSVHTSASGNRIIGLAANGTRAYWIENVPLAGNRLRRVAFNGGVAETMAENLLRDKPWIDTQNVYFKTATRVISRLPLLTDGIRRDFAANSLEITQAIQRPFNDVPLVAGKTTWVRFYPELSSGIDAGAVLAALHGTRDGLPLPGSPLYPDNGAIPITAGMSLADRANTDAGWLFRLPESWTRTGSEPIPQLDTTIHLSAVIDPDGAYSDTDDPVDNAREREVLFTAKAPTCMRMRPVATNSLYQPADSINVHQTSEVAEALLPTAHLITFPGNDPLREINWCWKKLVYGPFCSSPYELNDDATGLLTKMGWLDYWADDPDVCFFNNARSLYAGIVHQEAEWESPKGSIGGMARRGKDQMLTKVPRYGQAFGSRIGLEMTMVHEIGHNFNRLHIDCGSPESLDGNYPYPTGDDDHRLDADLDADDPALHYGFDSILRQPVKPDRKDFLSYCDPSWISDYTWEAIFDRTNDPVFSFPLRAELGSGMSLVRVAGLIDTQAITGELDFAWTLQNELTSAKQLQELESSKRTTAAAGNPWHLRIRGNDGVLLLDEPIILTEVDEGDHDVPIPWELVIEAPTATVLRLQLLHNDTVLDSLTPEPGMPQLELTQPAGGELVDQELTVAWIASDPDDDPLLYTVLYSPDAGDTWTPLLANWGGTGTGTELLGLDLGSEPGSDGQSALLRVLASDGYNTRDVTSQPFTVAQRSPAARITQPFEGQVFKAGDTVPLNATTSDPEDGFIPDSQFAWWNGAIGAIADANGLAPGHYMADLTVTDSGGLEGMAEALFTVAPLSIPVAATASDLDGRCDDASYLDAIQLALTPYPDGTRATLRMAHRGSDLWLCYSGLRKSGGYVGLLIDLDNSRDNTVQTGDFGFFIAQNGTRFVQEGNGGQFESASAANLSARIFEQGDTWSAELRIRKIALGTWKNRVSLALGHFDQSSNARDTWPGSAALLNPDTWALTNLGLIGLLNTVDPDSAVLGSGDIELEVTGSDFDAESRVLWNGAELATTLVNADTLNATVPGALAPAAGGYGVAVGVTGVVELKTAELPVLINNPTPRINSLSPSTLRMASSGRDVTINGSDFVDGATGYWNGEPRLTTFIDPIELRITLSDSDLESDGLYPVLVLNPIPDESPSRTAWFTLFDPAYTVFIDGFE